MKFGVMGLILYIFFIGCAEKTAFSGFNLDKEGEIAALNIKNSKIMDSNKTLTGMVSVVYLNKIYPKKYKENEYFYITMYMKKINNTENISFLMHLNDKLPLSIKELNSTNKFSNLTHIKNNWSKYYMAQFKHENDNNLTFVIQSQNIHSDKLIFLKDEE